MMIHWTAIAAAAVMLPSVPVLMLMVSVESED
jgi:hypothetical protein